MIFLTVLFFGITIYKFIFHEDEPEKSKIGYKKSQNRDRIIKKTKISDNEFDSDNECI